MTTKYYTEDKKYKQWATKYYTEKKKYKQWTTKYYTERKTRLSNTNPTKTHNGQQNTTQKQKQD